MKNYLIEWRDTDGKTHTTVERLENAEPSLVALHMVNKHKRFSKVHKITEV